MDNLTIVIPFYNGHQTIRRLLESLPPRLPVVIVDDQSDEPLPPALVADFEQVRVIRPSKKGYFSGAVNVGITACKGEVLVLNQDVWLEGDKWLVMLAEQRERYALIGDGVFGHPAWPTGYVQGTFMFMSRAAIDAVGGLNKDYYPLWGSTCEWQLRICRAGFKALPRTVPGFHHARGKRPFGTAITQVLHEAPDKKQWFIRTPPKVSVVISAFNYGRYLTDAVHSLIGGPTSLGHMPGQTFQSFEVIIVNDASQDETRDVGVSLADGWKGVRYIELPRAKHADGLANNGTPVANNAGIKMSLGEYIAILCADDMMEPWRLAGMVAALDANPHSVIYDDMMRFSDGKRTAGLGMQDYDFEHLLQQNHVHAGILFPKQAWHEAGGYNPAMRYGREDWQFNVALGLAGYCGIRIKKPGYLYRRQGQGRSERNTNPAWRGRFREQMERLYPRVYAGERPAMCCGQDDPRRPTVSTNKQAPLVGADGMVLVEYTGGNVGEQTWDCQRPYARYVFSAKSRVKYVDARHVDQMLAFYAGGKSLFQLVKKAPAADLTIAPAEAQVINSPAPMAIKPAAVPDPEPKPKLEPDPKPKAETAVEVTDPGTLSVKELGKRLKTGQYSTAEMTAMLEMEKTGSNRGTAVRDLENAIANNAIATAG